MSQIITVELEVLVDGRDSPEYGHYVNDAQCQTKAPDSVREWAKAEAAHIYLRNSIRKSK